MQTTTDIIDFVSIYVSLVPDTNLFSEDSDFLVNSAVRLVLIISGPLNEQSYSGK